MFNIDIPAATPPLRAYFREATSLGAFVAVGPPDTSLFTPFVAGAVVCVLLGVVIVLFVRLRTIRRTSAGSSISDNLFESFFGDAEVGIAVLDEHGAIVRANGVFEEMTGYSEPSLIGKLYVDLIYHPIGWDARERIVGALDRFGESRQLTIRRNDGSVFRARFLVAPAPAALSRKQSVVFVEEVGPDRDRDEERGPSRRVFGRSSTSVRKNIARSSTRSRGGVDEQTFLATLSDELKTPLTVILGNATLLGEEVTSQQADFVNAISTGAERLIDRIEALMFLARLQADDIVLRTESVDVCAVVQNVVDQTRAQADEKELSVEVSRMDQPCLVDADPDALATVIRNLLENAIKFTEHGKISAAISIDGADVVVTVVDSGAGFDPKLERNLFQPFFQGSSGSTRRHRGIGLGLSIVNQLVESLGGRVWADSSSGQGSSFSVSLPRSRTLGLAA